MNNLNYEKLNDRLNKIKVDIESVKQKRIEESYKNMDFSAITDEELDKMLNDLSSDQELCKMLNCTMENLENELMKYL